MELPSDHTKLLATAARAESTAAAAAEVAALLEHEPDLNGRQVLQRLREAATAARLAHDTALRERVQQDTCRYCERPIMRVGVEDVWLHGSTPEDMAAAVRGCRAASLQLFGADEPSLAAVWRATPPRAR